MGAPAARAPRPPRHHPTRATHTALARRSPRPQPLPAAGRRAPQHAAAQRGLDHPAVHAYRQHRCTPMHQDGPSVSAKTPGRAVAYPPDVITLASHTTADKRRTPPLPRHHQDHTAASRSSSRKLAINTWPGKDPRCCAGRCMRPRSTPDVPAHPTTPTSSRSRPVSAASWRCCRWPANSPAAATTPCATSTTRSSPLPPDHHRLTRRSGTACRARSTDEPAVSSRNLVAAGSRAGQPTKNERPHPSRHPDRHLVAGPGLRAEHPDKQGRPTHPGNPRPGLTPDRSAHAPHLIR